MSSLNFSSEIISSLAAIASKKARHLIKDGYFTENDFEDLQQELMITILCSIDNYQGEIHYLHKFAKKIVSDRGKQIIEAQNCQKRGSEVFLCSLHDFIGNDSDSSSLLIDTIAENITFDENTTTAISEQIEFDIDLEKIINDLPKDLRELYELSLSMDIEGVLKTTGISRRTFYRKTKMLRKIFSNSKLFK